MRKLLPLATVLAIAGALLLPSVSSAQAPSEDSVTGLASLGLFCAPGDDLCFAKPRYFFDVHSDPTGENPSGSVLYVYGERLLNSTDKGSVSCLAVRGIVPASA